MQGKDIIWLRFEVTWNVNGKQRSDIRETNQTMQEMLRVLTIVLVAKKRSDYKYTSEVEVTIFAYLLRVRMEDWEPLKMSHQFKHTFLEDVSRDEEAAG